VELLQGAASRLFPEGNPDPFDTNPENACGCSRLIVFSGFQTGFGSSSKTLLPPPLLFQNPGVQEKSGLNQPSASDEKQPEER
jgi:hypothetical protein